VVFVLYSVYGCIIFTDSCVLTILTSLDEAILIMAYDLFDVLLNSVCKCFVHLIFNSDILSST
jgi:hypothetical protein